MFDAGGVSAPWADIGAHVYAFHPSSDFAKTTDVDEVSGTCRFTSRLSVDHVPTTYRLHTDYISITDRLHTERASFTSIPVLKRRHLSMKSPPSVE